IDPEKRHLLGQYFTREDLVDLIIGTVVDDAEKYYADPTCGSGTFLIRLYSRLKYLNPKLKHEDILEKIWGIDIGQFPAELSTINLFRQDVSNFENFPRVVNKNIFDVRRGATFPFPPPNAGNNYIKIDLQIPEFYGLIGNFPFIRQELIEKKVPGVKKKLAKLLAEEYIFTYPKLFDFKKIPLIHVEELNRKSKEEQVKLIHQWIDTKQLEIKLSGQADIFTYIYIHAATLLAKNGSFAIITSNSWLDASYGSVLKEFFLDNFKIKMIVASYAEPWFEVVADNTIFTVLEKEDSKESRYENIVHFVKIKKKLEELIPERNLQLESMKRWQRIDGIIRSIETSKFNAAKLTETINNFENNDFRIRLLKQGDLNEETASHGEMSRWGKYLRAPDVYFEILEKCKEKLIPLNKIASLKRGTTSGINDFFYLEKIKSIPQNKMILCRNKRGWEGEIETKYLKNLIKDPSRYENIAITKDNVVEQNLFVFYCNKSKAELKKAGDLGSSKYIEWGERQVTENNIKFPDVSSVKHRKNWYTLSNLIDYPIAYLAASNNRFIAFSNQSKYALDKRLYGIKPKNDNVLKLLNSFFNILHLEAYGKEINNGNAKEFTVEEVENMLVPNIDIDYDIASLSQRKIKPIFEEVKEKDRIALDSEILKKLGLDPRVYLPRIYDGIIQMVRERLELPKMRKKQQKQKIKISYEQVKESVIKECIGTTLKKFPESFYAIGKTGKDYDDLEFEIYNTSEKPLAIHSFMNQHEVSDESGQIIFTADSLIKAEFATLLAKPNIFRLKIPKDEKIAASIISNYKAYVRQLAEQIELNANQKLHSWAEAEKMTNEILEEYGLKVEGMILGD
ncbi:MAG: N-6 DNA methylase, partial [Planctomycetota bacterium]